MPRTFRKLNPEQVKWEEEGAQIEGFLRGASVVQFNTGPTPRYTFEREDGSLVFCFATTILQSLMESVEIGDYVRVTYTGDSETGTGQRAKLFDVEVAED